VKTRIGRIVVGVLAGLALMLFLIVAFGGGAGEIELVLFALVSVAFGWFVGRRSTSSQAE
jgi:uncharacterized membrane protein YccC